MSTMKVFFVTAYKQKRALFTFNSVKQGSMGYINFILYAFFNDMLK